MKKIFNKRLISFFLIMFCTITSVFAQKGDVPTQGSPPPPGFLPIDGGLSYLLVAGIVYSVYELKRKK